MCTHKALAHATFFCTTYTTTWQSVVLINPIRSELNLTTDYQLQIETIMTKDGYWDAFPTRNTLLLNCIALNSHKANVTNCVSKPNSVGMEPDNLFFSETTNGRDQTIWEYYHGTNLSAAWFYYTDYLREVKLVNSVNNPNSVGMKPVSWLPPVIETIKTIDSLSPLHK